jgi:hypothetical protein
LRVRVKQRVHARMEQPPHVLRHRRTATWEIELRYPRQRRLQDNTEYK